MPTTCAQTSQYVGCCSGVATLYYCAKNGTAPESKDCPAGQVCGWEAASGFYGCTTPPADADPSGKYPKQCP